MFLVMLPSLIMLIYANLVKITKCSYFLISWQILFKFGIQIYYRFKKRVMIVVMLPSLIMLIYANLVKIT